MLKKGIPAKDLRPFSMEDPYGLGIPSVTQQRLRERFHRKSETRAATMPRVTPPALSHIAREALQQVKRRAPEPRPVPRPATLSPTKKKSSAKSLGCLTTLIIIGALYGIGSVFVPLIWNAVKQEIVLQTGNKAYGEIVSAEPTNTTLNDKKVHVLTVLVHVPGYDPYIVSFEQALSESQSRHVKPDTWVELRYAPDEMRRVAIVSVGVPQPDLSDDHSSAAENTFEIKDIGDASPTTPHEDEDTPGDRVVDAVPSPTHPDPIDTSGATPELPAEKNPATPGTAAAPQGEPASPPAAPPLVCLQARACCQIAGAGACTSFAAPGVEAKACRKALRGFGRLAEAAGKTCSGLP